MALGAFLAGMVVGSSDYSLRAATEALPMRDAFAVLFFVSVGMLLQPVRAPRAAGVHRDRAGHRARRQSADRGAVRLADALSDSHGGDGGRVAGADRRVLVHPRHARPRPRDRPGRGGRRRRGHGDHLDHAQPAGVQQRSSPSIAGWRGLRRHRPRSPRMASRSAPPRCSIPTAARSSSATGRPAEPSRGCCARTASPRPSWT